MGGESLSFTKIGKIEIQIIPMTSAILGFVINETLGKVNNKVSKISL